MRWVTPPQDLHGNGLSGFAICEAVSAMDRAHRNMGPPSSLETLWRPGFHEHHLYLDKVHVEDRL